MQSLFLLIDLLLAIYGWIVVAYVVFGLLMAFGVVNAYNRFVNLVYEFLTRACEPVLRPIRKIVPRLGPVDIAPLLLLVAIWFVRLLLWEYWPRGSGAAPK